MTVVVIATHENDESMKQVFAADAHCRNDDHCRRRRRRPGEKVRQQKRKIQKKIQIMVLS